ncbi:hypothetical protein BXZ70DRAFT_907524 [Cristinia sonorae]|uniref:Uncharacterized protein n=1 Tax=Cristinia sonorae TaxID=1940300 RepID=A0A8K0XPL2_9AGAR|nr:hypothetical protein BXZ70DRAFT_907524 [Cristinia sonorae]
MKRGLELAERNPERERENNVAAVWEAWWLKVVMPAVPGGRTTAVQTELKGGGTADDGGEEKWLSELERLCDAKKRTYQKRKGYGEAREKRALGRREQSGKRRRWREVAEKNGRGWHGSALGGRRGWQGGGKEVAADGGWSGMVRLRVADSSEGEWQRVASEWPGISSCLSRTNLAGFGYFLMPPAANTGDGRLEENRARERLVFGTFRATFDELYLCLRSHVGGGCGCLARA